MRMFKGARQKLLGVYLPPSTEKIRKVVFDSLPKTEQIKMKDVRSSLLLQSEIFPLASSLEIHW